MYEISVITVEFLLDYIILTIIVKEFTKINVIKVCAKCNNDFSPFIGKSFHLQRSKVKYFTFAM